MTYIIYMSYYILYNRPRSKPDKTVYLKKCIAEHEDRNTTALLPYNIYDDFKQFLLRFIKMFPNEQNISVRYTLYCIALLYDH